MAHTHAHSGADRHGAGHDHGHSHAGHAHVSPPQDWRYGVGMALNLGFVAVEAGYGVFANSTALLADAGHNLSDVLGLALAGGAAWLARRPGSARRTYGFGRATILAALANAAVLLLACGAIVWEAVRRFQQPEGVQPTTVMVVAAIGIVINAATAALFLAGRKHDVNVRGAFLHMAADAGVSAGVVVAGALIAFTGRTWIDPVTSLAIVAVVVAGTWGLLRESLDLAMDTAPAGLDVAELRTLLAAQPGVAEVHDLHVWNTSTTETALTAHLVRPGGSDDAFLATALAAIRDRFGIEHVTIQIEDAHAHCGADHD